MAKAPLKAMNKLTEAQVKHAQHDAHVKKFGHADGPPKPTTCNQLMITYGKHASASQVRSHTQSVIQMAMLQSHVCSVRVESANRTAHDQARIMYNNLHSGHRIAYKAPGRAVTQAYDKAPHKNNAAETIALMEAEVNHQGLANVTNHGRDPRVLNTIDIAPSSIPPSKRAAFVKALNGMVGTSINRFLHPGNSKDPAYHIEVPAPKHNDGVVGAKAKTTG